MKGVEEVSVVERKSEESNHLKSKKRKFDAMNGEAEVSSIKKKKKFKKNSFQSNSSENESKFILYKKSVNYGKVVANPKKLLPAPKIFNKNNQVSVEEFNISDFFLSKFLNSKCLDSNSSRFSFFDEVEREELLQNETSSNDTEPNSNTQSQALVEEKKENKKIMPQSLKESESESSEKEKEEIYKSQVDMYKLQNKKGLLFHLHHPCKFSFFGEIKVTLVTGEVEILGYDLNDFSEIKSVNVYSPNFCTPLVIESKQPKQSKSKEEIKEALKNILSEEDIGKVLVKINPDDSLLQVEQIVSSFGIVINKYFEKEIFPKNLENLSSETESLKILQSIFNFSFSKTTKQITTSEVWERIPLGQCTTLCGGKGVGKSTLLKYYINKLVSKGENVLCLDFDPGQTEFTPPGYVSAVVVDKPVIGPNFTHITDSKMMIYFGEVDVSQGPGKYLDCVKYIIDYCRQNREFLKMKWFVNTMGFSKGLGVDLMITVLKLLKPNTVVQIRSADAKRNYPFYLTPTTVNAKKGFSSVTDYCIDNVVTFDLRVINSCAEREGKPLQGGLKARHLRDLMSISYFSRMVSPPYYNFNAVQPYLISFSKLYLGVDFLILPNDILKAFNGSLVSLSHFEPTSEEIWVPDTKTEEYFKIVVKPDIAPSLGLGFVRGIDCNEKKIYLITHLPLEKLQKINCLSLGKICPSHSMFLKQDTVESQPFYTSISTIGAIRRVKRMFRAPAAQQLS